MCMPAHSMRKRSRGFPAHIRTYVSPEMLISDLEWREILMSPHFQENLQAIVVDGAN